MHPPDHTDGDATEKPNELVRDREMSELSNMMEREFKEPSSSEKVNEDDVVMIEDQGVAEGDIPTLDTMSNVEWPNPKMYITCILKDGSSNKVTVFSRQPKISRKWGGWLNVQQYGSEVPGSVNLEDVVGWREIQEPERLDFLSAAEEMSQEVLDAKEREIYNLIENDVFEVVEDKG